MICHDLILGILTQIGHFAEGFIQQSVTGMGCKVMPVEQFRSLSSDVTRGVKPFSFITPFDISHLAIF